RIETAAAAQDVEAYYGGIFDFAAVGLKASQNPLLISILTDLGPSNRRIQYASLASRGDELASNVRFFRKMHSHLVAGEVTELENIVQAYARNEKEFALAIANGDGPSAAETGR
ncbi:MAG: hypothetical protein PVJ53_12510, partial [Desulfobacterales bacterium]